MQRKKIVMAVPFPVYPPVGGGQLRAFHLAKNLTKWFDVVIISLGMSGKPIVQKELGFGLREIRVSKSRGHFNEEIELTQKLGVFSGLVCLPELHYLTPAYMEQLDRACQDAFLVVACHPYVYSVIKCVTEKPVWYEAQDVESDLYSLMLTDSEMIEKIKSIEKKCATNSEFITVCSQEDKERFIELYHLDSKAILVLPNGVDLTSTICVSPSEKSKFKITNQFTVIFVGSAHPPNLIAVEEIVNIAQIIKRFRFIIIGSCCNTFYNRELPSNIELLGIIDEEEKKQIFSVADIALNPMPYGSGTNIKMLEYFVCGIPVVSTNVGVRGLDVKSGEHLIISNIKEFHTSIELLAESIELRAKLSENSFRWVAKNYGWDNIVGKVSNEIFRRNLARNCNELSHQIKIDYGKYQKEIRVIAASRGIYIWGAGSGGFNTFIHLKKLEIIPRGFIDNNPNKWGTAIEGVSVISPNDIPKILNPFVIISSIYANEIREQLEAIGKLEYEDYFEQDTTVPFLVFL